MQTYVKSGSSVILSFVFHIWDISMMKIKFLTGVFGPDTANIDLIIGGHWHTFLRESLERLLNKEGKPVLINQVGWAGIALGHWMYTLRKKRGTCITAKT